MLTVFQDQVIYEGDTGIVSAGDCGCICFLCAASWVFGEVKARHRPFVKARHRPFLWWWLPALPLCGCATLVLELNLNHNEMKLQLKADT